jgi:hypothetical protein
MIPAFRSDGNLPEGLHTASESELTFPIRIDEPAPPTIGALRVRQWIELARAVHARHLLIDGSFVTEKREPNDVDAVVLLPADFQRKIEHGIEPALELEQMLLTRHPEEIFAAEDDNDWDAWVEFFGRTREPDSRRKGLVEVQL